MVLLPNRADFRNADSFTSVRGKRIPIPSEFNATRIEELARKSTIVEAVIAYAHFVRFTFHKLIRRPRAAEVHRDDL